MTLMNTTTKHTKEGTMSKLLCFLGFHKWTCTLQDYIDEFGCVPLDARIASKSRCERCKKTYKGGQQ
jgi:hypothetical protein